MIDSVDDFIKSQLSEAEFEQALIEGEAAYDQALNGESSTTLPTITSEKMVLTPAQYWFIG